MVAHFILVRLLQCTQSTLRVRVSRSRYRPGLELENPLHRPGHEKLVDLLRDAFSDPFYFRRSALRARLSGVHDAIQRPNLACSGDVRTNLERVPACVLLETSEPVECRRESGIFLAPRRRASRELGFRQRRVLLGW